MDSRRRARAALVWLLRIFLVFFFVDSGVQKLLALDELSRIILEYRIIGPGPARVASYLLPLAEIAAGLGLILGPRPSRASAMAIAALLVFYAGVLSSTLVRGIRLSQCGCGRGGWVEAAAAWIWVLAGGPVTSVVEPALLRNIVLIAVALIVFRGFARGWPSNLAGDR